MFQVNTGWTQRMSQNVSSPNTKLAEIIEFIEYMKWLGEELSIKSKDGWYGITAQDFASHHGQQLIKQHQNVGKVVGLAFPEHKWDQSKFDSEPVDFEKIKHDLKAERNCILTYI